MKYEYENSTAFDVDEKSKDFTPKYIVCVGSKSTIENLAKDGFMQGLNRKTMRYQKFAMDAKYLVVYDTDSRGDGYVLLSNTDIVKEAIRLDLLFMNGIRNECRVYVNV